MNLTIFFAAVFCININTINGDPTESVFYAFGNTFPLAKAVRWSETRNSFHVAFNQNQIEFRVNYDKKGNITSMMRYYYKENLPVMILARINKKFADKKVFGVAEESSVDGILYHITLEGAEDWIELTANSSGNLTVEQTFKKA